MSWLERDGVRLRYEVHGACGAPPLLLTHGYGVSRSLWDANVEALALDREVTTWDLRGHGDSDVPEDSALYAHELCIQDMVAVLDAVGAERAVLVGMSLGGFLSLGLHLRYPERVVALVLVDTGPGYRSVQAREGWNQWALDRPDPARWILLQHDSSVFDSLPSVSVPTLVVVGERDTQFLGAAEVMASRIPHARKVVLADAGHAANADAPEQFNAVVREFLEEL